jgi:hypothetical protein
MARQERPVKSKPSTERLTFSLDEVFRAKLKKTAELKDRSEAWVVREAVEKFIESYKLPPEQSDLDLGRD